MCLDILGLHFFSVVGRLLTLADDSVKLRSVLEVDHNKWNTLGILLGFTQEVLQNMASSAGGMESYLNRMIISWLSGDASQQPTLESLATALRHPKMGEEKVAAKLLEGLSFRGSPSKRVVCMWVGG